MNYLFTTKTNDYETLFIRMQTSLPSVAYTIRIKISLNINNNTIVSVFKNHEWKHLFEDSYRETGGNNQERNTKLTEYSKNIYMLLCE